MARNSAPTSFGSVNSAKFFPLTGTSAPIRSAAGSRSAFSHTTAYRNTRLHTDRTRKVFAGQNVGVKQVSDQIWLVSFMDYDLGFFDDETCRLESAANPFGAK